MGEGGREGGREGGIIGRAREVKCNVKNEIVEYKTKVKNSN